MRRGGFTLVEIIVATVIGAFVALTAMATLRTITTSRSKFETNAGLASELRYGGGMIRRDLVNLYRDVDSGEVVLVGTIEESDDGIANRLLMRTVNRVKARQTEPEGDVYDVEYSLTKQEDKGMLMRRLFPNPQGQEHDGGVVMAVAENIESFDVMYYDGEGWVNDWPEEKKGLPQMMQVSLTAREPKGKAVVGSSFVMNFSRWPSGRN